MNETVERFSVITCPQSGDCCVFCSYGSVKCPPQELDQGCCS